MRFAPSMLVVPVALAAASVAYAAPIAVGAKVPANFSAVDTAGKARNFASIAGKKGTVLIFFRSASWCPYCQAQLKDVRALPAELAKRGYSLAAISYDSPEKLADFTARQSINYTLLSDKDSKMIDAFGLRDPAYPKGNFAYGVPTATVLVIGADGVVKQKLTTADYKVRPSNATILAAVDRG
ncbi:peroxiredoxin family protein [Sphingomonas sp. CCH10-B3]|uniref:peroxiredoxin family protein n=2 Tax=Sphingomonas TaxID=13687 RepID=UPI0009E8F1AD|nr:peroxiredoxin family protein [Sphingomonas sp. CCH10-B3]